MSQIPLDCISSSAAIPTSQQPAGLSELDTASVASLSSSSSSAFVPFSICRPQAHLLHRRFSAPPSVSQPQSRLPSAKLLLAQSSAPTTSCLSPESTLPGRDGTAESHPISLPPFSSLLAHAPLDSPIITVPPVPLTAQVSLLPSPVSPDDGGHFSASFFLLSTSTPLRTSTMPDPISTAHAATALPSPCQFLAGQQNVVVPRRLLEESCQFGRSIQLPNVTTAQDGIAQHQKPHNSSPCRPNSSSALETTTLIWDTGNGQSVSRRKRAHSDRATNPLRSRSFVCSNVRCGSSSTPLWRKGWKNKDGTIAMLCNACGLHYKKGHFCAFCNQIFKESDIDDHLNPFVNCAECERWIHLLCAQSRQWQIRGTSPKPRFLCPECLERQTSRDPLSPDHQMEKMGSMCLNSPNLTPHQMGPVSQPPGSPTVLYRPSTWGNPMSLKAQYPANPVKPQGGSPTSCAEHHIAFEVIPV